MISLQPEEKQVILIVDDVPANIDVLSEILRLTYQVKVVTSGMMALKIAMQSNPPDLIRTLSETRDAISIKASCLGQFLFFLQQMLVF